MLPYSMLLAPVLLLVSALAEQGRAAQRNNLLPVGVTTAVLGGAYLAWVLFKRRGTGTA
ncbi:hypothetical protein ACFW84_28380 [Streptomyces anulatus]|uniref:hypothetical protein n=1 Tax=Streptomyces anulatus TaxID=1892 RepID=UPI0036B2EA8B